jgi:hypothetical protein
VLLTVLVSGLVLAMASGAVAGATGPGAVPFVSVTPGAATSGTFVDAAGGGFQPGTMVVAEICGRPAGLTLAGCGLSVVNAVADDAGQVRVRILVEPPEVGCPCAVRLRATGDRIVVEAPLAVDGVPGAFERTIPVASSGQPASLRLVDVSLLPDESWTARLGGPHRATLSWTLEHVGGSPVVDPEVTVRIGTDDTWLATLPSVRPGPLLAGERQRGTASVDLGFMATGVHNAEVSFGSAADAVVASVDVRPWALWVLLGLVVVEVLLFGGRNLLRRHLAVDVRTNPGVTARLAASAVAAPPAPSVLGSDWTRLRELASAALFSRRRPR